METPTIDATAGGPPHSRIGIAGFAASLIGAIVFCIAFAIAFGIGFTGGVVDTSNPMYMAATLTFCGSLSILLIGLGLSLASLFQAGQNKTFGIIGLVLDVTLLCVFGILMVIGLSAQS